MDYTAKFYKLLLAHLLLFHAFQSTDTYIPNNMVQICILLCVQTLKESLDQSKTIFDKNVSISAKIFLDNPLFLTLSPSLTSSKIVFFGININVKF